MTTPRHQTRKEHNKPRTTRRHQLGMENNKPRTMPRYQTGKEHNKPRTTPRKEHPTRPSPQRTTSSITEHQQKAKMTSLSQLMATQLSYTKQTKLEGKLKVAQAMTLNVYLANGKGYGRKVTHLAEAILWLKHHHLISWGLGYNRWMKFAKDQYEYNVFSLALLALPISNSSSLVSSARNQLVDFILFHCFRPVRCIIIYWTRYGIRLYRFLILAFFSTLL